MQIVIIEDVLEMRVFLEEVLKTFSDSTQVHSFSSYSQARAWIQSRGPDLVLVDELIPGESVYDFSTFLVQYKMPFVMISGMKDRAAELPSLGQIGFLEKPGLEPEDGGLTPEQFLNSLKKILDR